MLQNKSETDAYEDRFFQRVLESGTAWMLGTPQGGIAYCESHHSESPVFLFWSDRAYANRQRKDGWEPYAAVELSIEQLADLLSQMAGDDVLVGLNWDANLCGNECHPGDAVIRLGYLVDPPSNSVAQSADAIDDPASPDA